MFKNKYIILSLTLLLVFSQIDVFAEDTPKSNLKAEMNFDTYQANIVSQAQNSQIKIILYSDLIKTVDIKTGKTINIFVNIDWKLYADANASVVYDGKKFVVITNSGKIYESINGTDWSVNGCFFDLTGEKYKDKSRLCAYDLEFYDGTYYISAGNQGIYKSNDMKTFKNLNAPVKEYLCDYVFKTIKTKSRLLIFWGNGEPKESFTAMSSSDEKNWSIMGTTFCAHPITAVEFKNHIYLLSEYSNVNIDGHAYYQKGLKNSLVNFYIEKDKIYALDSTNRIYSFVEKGDYLQYKYIKTINNNLSNNQNNFSSDLNKVIYNGKRYIAFYSSAVKYENEKGFYYYTSEDSKTWKRLRLPIDTVVDLDSGDDRTVFISKDVNNKGNKYVLSILKDNKIKKVAIPIPLKYKNMVFNSSDDSCGVRYSNNKFILWISLRKDKNAYGAKGLNTLIFSSKDGLKWNFESSIENFDAHSLYYDGSILIFNGYHNKIHSILESSDMKKWNKANISLQFDDPIAIGKYNGKYVCFSFISNSVYDSSNAITWNHVRDINLKDYNINDTFTMSNFSIVSDRIFLLISNNLYTTTDYKNLSIVDGYHINAIEDIIKTTDGYIGVGTSSSIFNISVK